MSVTTKTGIPGAGLVLAILAAPACGAGSRAGSAPDAGPDGTLAGSSTVSNECPATACDASPQCGQWAALCEQRYSPSGEVSSSCAACNGANDSQRCDQEYCRVAYPALADAGTVFGDCDTTTGRCRCFVISDDGGRSGYLDKGGVSCARGTLFDGGDQQPWNCQPPVPLPEGGTCSLPPFSPQVYTVTVWFEDDAAPQGGWTVTLGPNESATVGGHVYRNSGGGRVGAGPYESIAGDVLLDVDGVPGQLRFHHTGCATNFGGQFWQYQAALTRTNPFCPGCLPATIERQFAITSNGDGSTEFEFVLQSTPGGCGVGVDLLGFVTH